MKTKTEIPTDAPETPLTRTVKIFGVGSAGVSLLDTLNGEEFAGAGFVAVNTEASSLAASSAPVKIHLETKLLRGLGTGGDPERGRAIAEEQFATLKSACEGADVILIVAGLGGGAGSGISPVLARAAKETGALVLAFVTLPFLCEGNRRKQQAEQSLEQLKSTADGVICLPSQKAFKLIDENTSVLDTFRITGGLLVEGVRGVWQLLTRPGLIQIHFDDLCALVRDRHFESAFAFVEAGGAGAFARGRGKIARASAARRRPRAGRIRRGAGEPVGGKDLTMAEVNRVMEQISRQCERAQIIMGAAIDATSKNKLSATVIAARHNPVAKSETGGGSTETLPARGATSRSAACSTHSFTPEQREQMVARHSGGGRVRRSPSKMLQAQLPLAIITKGRFDKSEPTVHKGEDLDIPTYIRRGVALNLARKQRRGFADHCGRRQTAPRGGGQFVRRAVQPSCA
jgi:cell division protein FtsZ